MNLKPDKASIVFIILLFSIVSYSYSIEYKNVTVGAERVDQYVPLLKNKKVGIVANPSSLIKNTHIVDSLLSLNVNLVRIFSPEHGFRGNADAGEHIGNYTDQKTGLPVISLYGANKKPKVTYLDELEVIIFDIQDVGVRFYTYISTMHYMMEACAEYDIDFIVLDRPNPNGFYVDGPVLDMANRSFVGMHPVPIVHGMTVGEFAKMINGEGWLKEGKQCNLHVIPCKNYTHNDFYKLPVKPSPNLPNMEAIYLYPSLGLFEGTVISVGRGTDFPFQVYGHPELKETENPDNNNDSLQKSWGFTFVPRSIEGASKNPKFKGITCIGTDLRNIGIQEIIAKKQICLDWLIDAYNRYPEKDKFFNSFFFKLAGNGKLKEDIIQGKSPDQIRESWIQELEQFKRIRIKYLLYEDFH
ncbi:MAG: DUF1343 domain-containing protein [Marinilabiliales bacterium]|nr:MAG: DUF1343 domain-containing protein [Marinilabiliales bacterium]